MNLSATVLRVAERHVREAKLDVNPKRLARVLRRTARRKDFKRFGPRENFSDSNPLVTFSPSIFRAAAQLGIARALKLFEREDLDALSALENYAGLLATPTIPVLAPRAFTKGLQLASARMAADSEHLLKTGLTRDPSLECTDMVDPSLGRLYPTTAPWGGRHLSTSENLWEYSWDTDHHTSGHEPDDGDTLLPGLIPIDLWYKRRAADRERVESLRAPLLRLKHEVVGEITGIEPGAELDGCWGKIRTSLVAHLGGDDAEFLLRIDGKCSKLEMAPMGVPFESGGLSSVLTFLQIALAMLDPRFRKAIVEALASRDLLKEHHGGDFTLAAESYYALVGTPGETHFRRAVAIFEKHTSADDGLVAYYHARLREVLESDLDVPVPIVGTVPRRHATVFAELMKGPAIQIAACLKYGVPVGIGAPVTALSGTQSPTAPYTFRLEGEYWTIQFEGETARLRDRVGVRCLLYLLGAPDKQISAIELLRHARHAVAPLPDQSLGSHTDAQLEEEGLSSASVDAGIPAIDEEARTRYMDERGRLDVARREAVARRDHQKAAQLQGDIDAINHQLRTTTDIRGKARRVGSAQERARVAVSKHINVLRKSLQKPCPSFARHLKRVRLGLTCIYRPEPPVQWN